MTKSYICPKCEDKGSSCDLCSNIGWVDDNLSCGHPIQCWRKELDGCGWCATISMHDDAMKWVNDLQSGMYINCVYCGYRYGPNSEIPATMADVLKEHIEQCPKHPMSALKAKLEETERQRDRWKTLAAKDGDAPYDQGGDSY